MLSFNVNNGQVVKIYQYKHDKKVYIDTVFNNKISDSYMISPGDFIMLLNLYRYIKDHDIQNDFINPTGKNQAD